MNADQVSDGVLLRGLDGSNPLAFLAALGTLRIASISHPNYRVRMLWRIDRGAWRPSLTVEPFVPRDELIKDIDLACRHGAIPERQGIATELEERFRSATAEYEVAESETKKRLKKLGLSGKKFSENLKTTLEPFMQAITQSKEAWFDMIAPHLLIGDNLTLDRDAFSDLAAAFARSASCDDRCSADFTASFGSDAIADENGKIADTSLRTMAGTGHQHFLRFMRNIIVATTEEHLEKALFERWRYDDPVQNLTLRWDPADDSRYALRWRNPSTDSSGQTSGSMLGANRLAIEGMPLFPTAPRLSDLHTTGFRGRKSSNTFWTWPIWSGALGLDPVRSLVALSQLQADNPDRQILRDMGVQEVFRSQRFTIGKYRNFSPGQSV